KPPYFRVKVLRRLNQLGALAVKNSAYLLPENDDTAEDLHWLLREIKDEGGEGWIFSCTAVAGTSDDELRASFPALPSPAHVELCAEARRLLAEIRGGKADAAHRPAASGRESEWERLQRRAREIEKIDFFGARERAELEALMTEIENESSRPAGGALASLRGR